MILYRKWFRNLINVLYLPLSILGVFLAAIILDCEYQPGGQAGYIFSIFGLALVNLMYYIGFIRLRDNGFGSFLIVLFTIIAILMNLLLVLTTEEETFTKASVWNSGLSLMLGPCCLISFTIYKFKGEDLTPFFETFLPLIIAAIGYFISVLLCLLGKELSVFLGKWLPFIIVVIWLIIDMVIALKDDSWKTPAKEYHAPVINTNNNYNTYVEDEEDEEDEEDDEYYEDYEERKRRIYEEKLEKGYKEVLFNGRGIGAPIEAVNEKDGDSIDLTYSSYRVLHSTGSNSWRKIYKDDNGDEYYFDDETGCYLLVEEDD